MSQHEPPPLAQLMTILEFWPDYSGALIWSPGGERLSLDEVPLTPELRERAARWIAGYADSKLPWEPTRDDEWLTEGGRLFDDLRRALREHDIDLRPAEDFWAVDREFDGGAGG